jgi:hypothetical protein
MVLSGGTGTSWHICKTIKEYFQYVRLVVCDINPKHLVHSAVFADDFITILPIKNPQYEESMYKLFTQYHVDVLIPIIDYDLRIFCSDNKRLIDMHILSTGPKQSTFDTLSDKRKMNGYLKKIGVSTPKIFSPGELIEDMEYYVKDAIGFGSNGAYCAKGNTIKNIDEIKIIQEKLYNPEVTVDACIHKNKVFTLCRERLEIKSGVSTKVRTFRDETIQKTIEKIALSIELPVITCIQFMTDDQHNWSLTDFNLRAGAGTAMSAKVGFQSLRAAIAIWLNENIESLLQYPAHDMFVTRAYQEIVSGAVDSF